jgi:hypothetical protein
MFEDDIPQVIGVRDGTAPTQVLRLSRLVKATIVASTSTKETTNKEVDLTSQGDDSSSAYVAPVNKAKPAVDSLVLSDDDDDDDDD